MELAELSMNEPFQKKLEPYLNQDKLQLHHTDTHQIVTGFEADNLVTNLKFLQENCDEFFLNNLKKYIQVCTKSQLEKLLVISK